MRKVLRTRLIMAVFLFPLFSVIALVPVEAVKTEYICLTGRGNDMAPAICDGDTVRVKICTNGTLIQAGPKNSTHPGDIIVYCAAAAVPVPSSMWACGRAVSKYREDGKWYFKTQLDSSPEPDAWEVPEYYLLGVVVEVIHGTNSQNNQSNPSPTSYQEDLPRFSILTLAVDFIIGIVIGAVIGATVAKAYAKQRRNRLSTQVLGLFNFHIKC